MSSRKSKSGGIRQAREPKPEASEALSPIATLSLDVSGGHGRRYAGKFKFKVPTMGDRVDIAATKARYLTQVSNVEGLGDNIAEALAYLHTTIDDEGAPDWWKSTNQGVDLYDFQPLLTLYADARAYERKFLGTDSDVGEGAGEDPEGSGDDGEGAMGGDVSPASQRRTVLADIGSGGSRTGAYDAGDGGDEG